jgi:hypothetical protein
MARDPSETGLLAEINEWRSRHERFPMLLMPLVLPGLAFRVIGTRARTGRWRLPIA